MKVIFLGDIVGDAGTDYVCSRLPNLKKKHNIDVAIVNAENASEGNGLLPNTYDQLKNCGADIMTLGNHGLRRKEIYDELDKDSGLVRPINYHPDSPGQGYYIYDHVKFKLCVVNLQGSIYMQSYENPFTAIDRFLKETDCKNIIVDFHAEATSEKISMGFYLDGKVSAVLGTHTHVPTADARILPAGTGYVTDLGMCGARDSVLGVKKENAIYRARTYLPTRFFNEKENIKISGVILEIDQTTGKTTAIQPLHFI